MCQELRLRSFYQVSEYRTIGTLFNQVKRSLHDIGLLFWLRYKKKIFAQKTNIDQTE